MPRVNRFDLNWLDMNSMNDVVKPENESSKPAGQAAQNSLSLSTLAKQFYMQHWGLLLSAALILAVLINLWPVLAPFVAAFVLAYLLAAPSRWVHSKLRGRIPLPVCAVLTFFVLLLVFSSVGLLLIPVVLTQLELIQNNLPQ
ncbi:MAG: AI-2E family transporter, partial [Limnobacter sp.]